MSVRKRIIALAGIATLLIGTSIWLRFASTAMEGETPDALTAVTVIARGEPDLPNFPGSEAVKGVVGYHRFLKGRNGPVAFYAKAVDQNGSPVPGVQFTMSLSIHNESMLRGDGSIEVTNLFITDSTGRFSFQAPRGRVLRLRGIEKDGYLWRTPGYLNFAYGEFHPGGTPDYMDSKKGAVFHLWKKGPTEPVIQTAFNAYIDGIRDIHPFNLLTGRLVENTNEADLIIYTPLVADPAKAARAERLITFAVPNGGIMETTNVYPYTALKDGYSPTWQWPFRPAEVVPGKEDWQRTFYVKARDGRVFGGLKISFDFSGPTFQCAVITNPAGSPVLEPDAAKLITDPEEIQRLDEATRVR
jgi:hypothetical protein